MIFDCQLSRGRARAPGCQRCFEAVLIRTAIRFSSTTAALPSHASSMHHDTPSEEVAVLALAHGTGMITIGEASAGLVCMDLNADDYVGIDDLLLLLSAFGGTCDELADDAVCPCVLLPSAFCLLPCCFMLAALPARLPPVSSILTD